MIRIYPYAELGRVNHGWLDARHHFSFGMYYNPKRRRFGKLRVINDDIIAAGAGFDPHSHADMEIITYVRAGAITHRDSMGNEGRTEAGDVQMMSAGSGIEHSEYNREKVETRLYQIWILPDEKGVKPRWDAASFPKQEVEGSLPLLVSGRSEDEAKGALFIHQDAAIYGGRLKAGSFINQLVKHQAYLLVSAGQVRIGNAVLHAGDGAEIENEETVKVKAVNDAELLLIDVPA